MIAKLTHIYNVTKSLIREHVVKASLRSSKWPTVRKHFLAADSSCAACGAKNKLQVHHREPFHDFPEKELDPTNFIVLCMTKKECHLRIGHGDNGNGGGFKFYNPDVVQDAARALVNPSNLTILLEEINSKKLPL